MDTVFQNGCVNYASFNPTMSRYGGPSIYAWRGCAYAKIIASIVLQLLEINGFVENYEDEVFRSKCNEYRWERGLRKPEKNYSSVGDGGMPYTMPCMDYNCECNVIKDRHHFIAFRHMIQQHFDAASGCGKDDCTCWYPLSCDFLNIDRHEGIESIKTIVQINLDKATESHFTSPSTNTIRHMTELMTIQFKLSVYETMYEQIGKQFGESEVESMLSQL